MKTYRPGQSKCVQAFMAGLYSPPITPAEVVEHESAVAAVRAEDERKRVGERDLFEQEPAKA